MADDELTLFAGDSPARTSPWLENALALLESEAGCSGSSCGLSITSLQPGFSSKTSLAYCPPMRDATSLVSSGISPGTSPKFRRMAGEAEESQQDRLTLSRGACLTLSISAWPSDGSVCSLSDILETCAVPQKYYLSPKACRGILRRAAKRGKTLPEHLKAALEAASQEQNLVVFDKYNQADTGDIAHPIQAGSDAHNNASVPLVFDERNITSPTNRQACRPGDPVPTMHEKPMAVVVPIDMRQASRGEKMTNNRPGGSSGGAPGTGIGDDGDPCPTVSSHVPAVAFQESQSGFRARETHATLDSNNGSRRHQGVMGVRRLTPRECERLQGFPDCDFTRWDAGDKEISDSARYRMLGNAVSVPVAEWIGRRIMENARDDR